MVSVSNLCLMLRMFGLERLLTGGSRCPLRGGADELVHISKFGCGRVLWVLWRMGMMGDRPKNPPPFKFALNKRAQF